MRARTRRAATTTPLPPPPMLIRCGLTAARTRRGAAPAAIGMVTAPCTSLWRLPGEAVVITRHHHLMVVTSCYFAQQANWHRPRMPISSPRAHSPGAGDDEEPVPPRRLQRPRRARFGSRSLAELGCASGRHADLASCRQRPNSRAHFVNFLLPHPPHLLPAPRGRAHRPYAACPGGLAHRHNPWDA